MITTIMGEQAFEEHVQAKREFHGDNVIAIEEYQRTEDWRGLMVTTYFAIYDNGRREKIIVYEGAPSGYAATFPGGLTKEQVGWQLVISMHREIEDEMKDSTDIPGLLVKLNEARHKHVMAMDKMHRVEQRQKDLAALLERAVKLMEETGPQAELVKLLQGIRHDFEKS